MILKYRFYQQRVVLSLVIIANLTLAIEESALLVPKQSIMDEQRLSGQIWYGFHEQIII